MNEENPTQNPNSSTEPNYTHSLATQKQPEKTENQKNTSDNDWYTEPVQVTVDQYRPQSPSLAIRQPQLETPYQDQINKTIAKATIEGKATNTVKAFKHRLTQLSKLRT